MCERDQQYYKNNRDILMDSKARQNICEDYVDITLLSPSYVYTLKMTVISWQWQSTVPKKLHWKHAIKWTGPGKIRSNHSRKNVKFSDISLSPCCISTYRYVTHMTNCLHHQQTINVSSLFYKNIYFTVIHLKAKSLVTTDDIRQSVSLAVNSFPDISLIFDQFSESW